MYFSGASSFPNVGIIGGHDTNISSHPWQVSLQYNDSNNKLTHSCGGCLITTQWVLTAAHCVSSRTPKNQKVRVGATSYDNGGQVVNIEKIISHEEYVYTEHDIALLKLETPVTGQNIKPIALPSKDLNIPSGSLLNVTGWGLTQERGNQSVILQEVAVPYVSTEVCQSEFGGLNITKRHLCAGFEEGGKGPCNSDSGGPAVYKNEVVGVVSFSVGCARPHSPTIYTRVSEYLTWIQQHMV